MDSQQLSDQPPLCKGPWVCRPAISREPDDGGVVDHDGTADRTSGTTPQSQCAHWDSFRLAVPEKCIGLTLILAFFDRCGNSGFPSSATGGGNPQFPFAGEPTRRKTPQSASRTAPLSRGAYKEILLQ